MTVTCKIQPDGNLLITANNAMRSEIADALHSGRSNAATWADLLEPYACNGSFADCEGLIALWDGPAICEWVDYTLAGDRVPMGGIWAFMRYEVECPLQQLASYGGCIFRGVP